MGRSQETAAVPASARPYSVFDANGRAGLRNGARGPDYFATDVSLGWPVSHGRVDAGLVLNIYNVFNRTNYDR